MQRYAKGYSLHPSPAPPMPWEAYSGAVQQELSALLESGTCTERTYQSLIERHPSLLPWMEGTFGGGHHGLVHGAVITQPRLVGLQGKQPDFLYIARDTGSVYAVLVEIESPCKRWFTKAGQPTAKLTQAIDQLRQWKHWFERPGSVDKFLSEYDVPEWFSDWRRFERRYLLVYGRRDELIRSSFASRRSQHQAPDEKFISFDHLSPSYDLRDIITATASASGLTALWVPPTVHLGPLMAMEHCSVACKADVADRHPMMSTERAKFLKERWPYWDAWAAKPDRGVANTGDWE